MRLKHTVLFDLKDGSAALISGRKALRLRGANLSSARRYRKVFSLFDQPGFKGFPKDHQAAIFLSLAREHRLLFAPGKPDDAVTTDRAISAIESAMTMWKPLPEFHEVFSVIQKRPQAFIVHLLEAVSFIRRGPDIMLAAARSASDKSVRKYFSAMYESEKDHYRGLIQAMRIDEATFSLHDPCPGTYGLLAHLFQLAVTDPLSLAISFAFFETAAEDAHSVKDFYRKMEKLTRIPAKAFVAHHIEDIEAGHLDAWKPLIASQGPYRYGQVSKWISDLHTTKHLVELYYDSQLATIKEISSQKRTAKLVPASFIRVKPELGAVEDLLSEEI